MNTKKIVFLFLFTFITLKATENVTILSAHAEKIERLKVFSKAVWKEMQRQPNSFFVGAGAAAVVHASSLSTSHYETIAQITHGRKIESSQLLVDGFQSSTNQALQKNPVNPDAMALFQNQNSHNAPV
jgi:hypothetical protein